ncbi:DUF3825 domain-containing protein [Lacrimispora sp.]|uniref:DUF3825 domain-containing protein n=1 Tax=Lacrimispora sp. TaxID=2719234 RepID=UPI00289EF38E|nr:DUF3825 domain-containing protein [Lacrimispora sp.]
MEKEYSPEGYLYKDAYMGNQESYQKKINYLANTVQPEEWGYSETEGNYKENFILKNYILYTYDQVKEEGKIEISSDGNNMCFNTGLQTLNGNDVFAFFATCTSKGAKPDQKWYFIGFCQGVESRMKCFSKLPDVADYFTNPSDFIFDRKLELILDYDHIIDDNYERFVDIGYTDKHLIKALLMNATATIKEKLKRNYKLAIPQYFTDKGTGESKIQLLLPLFLKGNNNIADLALVVDKTNHNYIGKTVLTIGWAYVNSRRIVKPDADWLKI